ncbi:MAG: type IV toxin-antitoxin system AbiEi family antitoxin domain-containing protein [Solirubrobacterales bacterium]|nr:type IV toxin-antitoxin system AbiEi family antitoxin domain-containing protein [Solirubrobacterales bacterium]
MTHLGSTPRELELLALANRQHGVVHGDQLRRRGLDATAIYRRTCVGRLTRLHDGVFAWGHSALTDEGRWLSALWACGPESALSHWSCAACLHVGKEPNTEVHISTTRSITSRPGIVVHRVKRLDPIDVRRRGLLRHTAVPRTLIDLADVGSFAELRAATDTLRTFSPVALAAAQRRAPGRPGRGNVTRLLEADQAHTKSELERRYLRLLRRHGLPRPSGLNVWVGGHKADCVYEDQRLVVELDGRAYHLRRTQIDADHRRDEDYQLAGHLILRLLWDDFHAANEAATVVRVRRMLDRRAR